MATVGFEARIKTITLGDLSEEQENLRQIPVKVMLTADMTPQQLYRLASLKASGGVMVECWNNQGTLDDAVVEAEAEAVPVGG